jgi:hypothetical protein
MPSSPPQIQTPCKLVVCEGDIIWAIPRCPVVVPAEPPQKLAGGEQVAKVPRGTTLFLRLGVHEFLIKPISAKALQQRLIGILLNPRPMVLVDGYYVPLPRQPIDRTQQSGDEGQNSRDS